MTFYLSKLCINVLQLQAEVKDVNEVDGDNEEPILETTEEPKLETTKFI